jgi:hypothetical protein
MIAIFTAAPRSILLESTSSTALVPRSTSPTSADQG